jgi:hypothetical protein
MEGTTRMIELRSTTSSMILDVQRAGAAAMGEQALAEIDAPIEYDIMLRRDLEVIVISDDGQRYPATVYHAEARDGYVYVQAALT